jgi:hypothetical protein
MGLIGIFFSVVLFKKEFKNSHYNFRETKERSENKERKKKKNNLIYR